MKKRHLNLFLGILLIMPMLWINGMLHVYAKAGSAVQHIPDTREDELFGYGAGVINGYEDSEDVTLQLFADVIAGGSKQTVFQSSSQEELERGTLAYQKFVGRLEGLSQGKRNVIMRGFSEGYCDGSLVGRGDASASVLQLRQVKAVPPLGEMRSKKSRRFQMAIFSQASKLGLSPGAANKVIAALDLDE